MSVPKKCETGGPSVCRGTQYDDEITGTPNNDTIKSLAGWDYVLGRDGDDTAFGGPGTDYLYGEQGGDSLFGGSGPDGIYPAQGEDEVQAGDGDDRIYAPPDVLVDRISCGKGDATGSYLAKRTTSPKIARSRTPLVGAA